MREKLVLIAVVFLIVGFGWYILDFELEKLTKPSSDAVVDIGENDHRDDVENRVDDEGENREYINNKPATSNIIGAEEAKSIVLSLANGNIIGFTLQDDGRLIYKVEVELDGVEHLVKIDAYTGEVISHEVD